MSIEQGEKVRNSLENASEMITKEQLEQLLAVKEPKLPKSIRSYIRQLKQVGRWEEAMGLRQEEMEKARKKRGYKTREERAREELDRTVKLILETEDSQLQAESELRAVWLLDISGVINQKERVEDLLSILDSKTPWLKNYLEDKLIEIRDQALKI